MSSNTAEQLGSLERIERNLLIFFGLYFIGVLYWGELSILIGALLGGLVAFINFRFIHSGVEKVLITGSEIARKRYVFFFLFRFICTALFLGLAFYYLRPSIFSFFIGFSLFIPSILFETFLNINQRDQIGETISGSRN